MKLYSDFAPRRTRQVLADVTALALIAAWVWLGVTVYGLVAQLAQWGRDVENAGAGFRDTMTEVGENLGSIPLIGPGIRVPFDGASGAGETLEAAGQSQQETVALLATTLGVGIAVLPIVTILLLWLIPRARFVRRAGRVGAIAASSGGIDLLALRALATQRLSVIATVDADAMSAWRRGDEAVMRKLAAIELEASGIRLTDGQVVPTTKL
ncbi:hypothetical protein M2152_001191 [Microbacteriaceae bacterium SG_E_30_P1]|uniref:Uncharacterized protein n=1 Tax=Antiquaquibacter oligotrophicus TaxID=2880260 RepID=A0ABT6KMC7_9MICO|nr:hypothetical protein [Antiquaquibacter oligotrophicus]MDH6181009.1 hypothetical protein [Antiquaquibacter oligotrophicus]UDF13291.1 hypothetical protein LH407_00025 [Antiquaquibacter oligotrophicus]